jgi:hypothetical protein
MSYTTRTYRGIAPEKRIKFIEVKVNDYNL